MALIPPQPTDLTLAEVDKRLISAAQAEPRRKYLGASSIGDSCARKLWYRLHTDYAENFDAATLRRFEDGHRSEDVMAGWLRLVPEIELYTHTPEGGQYGFEDRSLGSLPFSGHYDGVMRGLLEAPKTWHIWEHKSVNEKKFAQLKKLKSENEKTALEKWDRVYHAQGIIYMDYESLDRHYLTVSTPGLRDYISVRTERNPVLAAGLREKAKRIINAKEPPERIGGRDWYECRYCPFYNTCHA